MKVRLLRFDEDFVARGEVAGGRSDDGLRADENFLSAANGVANVGLADKFGGFDGRGEGLGVRGQGRRRGGGAGGGCCGGGARAEKR